MSDATHARSVTGATLIDSSPLQSPSASTFVDAPKATTERIVPPEHPYRTLVLCFDGTGDQFDADNSNIVEFFTLLKKDDRSKQMVYYQAGIGTYTTPQVATPLMAKISKALDEAIAWNLDAHVMGGYEFLMQNYTAGDRICIFGFSRGSYTARSLAGMIHKVGILPACNHQQVPFAYKMYTRADEIGWEQSNAFKKAFSIDADIEFIGVWDTVNSVGLIPKRLPFTTSNTNVRTFRHAVALDERRAKFKANLWNRPSQKEAELGLDGKPKDRRHHCDEPSLMNMIADAAGKQSDHSKHAHTLRALERKYSKDRNSPTDIEEVWFAGCHCDVGGGSVSNDTKPNLARIPLRWMIRECFRTNTGIMFHADLLEDVMGVDSSALYPTVLPRSPPLKITAEHYIRRPTSKATASVTTSSQVIKRPTEEELELADALSPIYDQLSLKWFWWILEFWPVRMRYQQGDGSWKSFLGWNLGRGRIIPKQKTRGVKVHRSVKMRLEAQHEDGGRYVPKAKFDEQYVTWVD
ncbi:hypothetical protein E1B28_012970 [Marasmius oreades]|uniref:T6SS Phospholipase effector Tle1-like catalytic domain-containing protein n=1 Tax=Marasmius oreades TaxID=181124 RepID=A0A9P7RPB9_9AGAR|nr:uncharacterized protein E1B28_012970 [Marasmius oreades]KAG7086992.1 hypothetical protein E1B28_012970 [Marasmius oreades]